MQTKNYTNLISEVLDITKHCAGSGLVREIETLVSQYSDYLATTPIPQSAAKWVEQLFDLIDNCEGSELEQELKALKLPKVKYPN